MTGTTLVTADTVDIVLQVLMSMMFEEGGGVLLSPPELVHTVSSRTVCRVIE